MEGLVLTGNLGAIARLLADMRKDIVDNYSKRARLEVRYDQIQEGDYIVGKYDEIWEVLLVVISDDTVAVELWRPADQHYTSYGLPGDRAIVHRLPQGVIDESLRTRVEDRRYNPSPASRQEDYRSGYRGPRRLPRIEWGDT